MIAPSWFLTAAHCVAVLADEGTLVGHYPDDKGEMRQGVLEVVLGLDDLSSASPSAAYAVNKVVVHEQFMRTYRQIRAKGYAPWRAVDLAAMSGGHDIALINLKRPWEGRLARISTSAKTDPQTPGSTLHVAGFGFSDPNPTKRVMRQFRRGEHEVYFAGS